MIRLKSKWISSSRSVTGHILLSAVLRSLISMTSQYLFFICPQREVLNVFLGYLNALMFSEFTSSQIQLLIPHFVHKLHEPRALHHPPHNPVRTTPPLSPKLLQSPTTTTPHIPKSLHLPSRTLIPLQVPIPPPKTPLLLTSTITTQPCTSHSPKISSCISPHNFTVSTLICSLVSHHQACNTFSSQFCSPTHYTCKNIQPYAKTLKQEEESSLRKKRRI